MSLRRGLDRETATWQRDWEAPRQPHSLRAPVTDENFYFVMADRFENGATTNDTGGIPGTRLEHGFDPTSRGFYNGGDLEGLLDQIDYIQGLGTTSIWLTPSFKNKAVQLEDGPSAGYHGYWVTDFTQIDPHLGTNEELRDARRRSARARDEGVLRHHHQPHRRCDRLRGGCADRVRSQGRRAVSDCSGTAVRRPRLRRQQYLPAAEPEDVLPVHTRARGG